VDKTVMLHAFDAHPKHPAVDYLVRLHADLGGRIQAAKAQAERLASDARHVVAVIRMFDPDYNVRAIAAVGESGAICGSREAPCSGTHWTCSGRLRRQ
jgi:hypothetical protein